MPDWYAEAPILGYRQQYRLLRRLHAEHTGVQALEVVELEPFGRALVLDGALQTSIGDEFTYHEPLVHVPLFGHPNPRRVLVVGGGDGGALRHVLLHPSVERAVQAEIDGGVVEASRKYLPEISGGAYDNPRVELLITDGARFMEETTERFDVILVDSTDPVGPAAALIGDPFIRATRRALAPGGLVAMQSSSPVAQPLEFVATITAFRRVFPSVKPYLSWVLLYPGVVWSWVAASETTDPAAIDEARVADRLSQLPERLRIYNAPFHRAAFALPTFIEALASYDHPPSADELRAIGHPLPGLGAA